MNDQLNRYLFDNVQVRGEIAQASTAYQEIIKHHDYPAPVRQLLGELLVATSLLTATLKFEGEIAVQLQGDGPVSLAVINGNNEQQLRGVARYEGDVTGATLRELFGKGHMVITITPAQGERYQGIVELAADSLAEALETYFERSEQLKTKLWLRCDEQHAAGMLLQVLPSATGNDDDFLHLQQLTDTIKNDELFTLDAQEILRRLYHQEEVRLFDPQAISFVCGCSRERSGAAIKSVGIEEARSIVAEQNGITINCEYCGKQYQFDAVDVEGLFADAEPGPSQVQ